MIKKFLLYWQYFVVDEVFDFRQQRRHTITDSQIHSSTFIRFERKWSVAAAKADRCHTGEKFPWLAALHNNKSRAMPGFLQLGCALAKRQGQTR